MREIKFRAWDKRQKRMITPSLLCNLTGDMEQENEYIILMEYTGLKDRNGKDIYEGDIVKYRDYEPINREFYTEYIAIVEYKWCMFGVQEREDFALIARLENIEVIGNIYENQELLKQG